MPLVSKCPKCRRQVTIPDGLDPQCEVRCPLCVAVYRLEEALAEAPPALIPIDTGAIRGPAAGGHTTAESDLIAEPYHVRDSGNTAEVPQQPDAVLEIDEEATREGPPLIDTGRAPADTYAFSGFSLQQSEEDRQSAAAVPTRRPRRRKNQKSAARFLIEVFAGGLLGLTVGYYAICWIMGPRHGLPELPLPLLPHTMHWFARPQQPAAVPDAIDGQSEGQAESPQPGPAEDDTIGPGLPPAEFPAQPAENGAEPPV
jgi:hypothetical protein